jgi:hypothetical protein
MRVILVGLMMSLLAASAAVAANGATSYDVTGVPIYQGPEYSSIDSMPGDITVGPEFHSFHHRGADEVGYSPLTLEDFRFPVVSRTEREFSFERMYYPDHSVVVWEDDCANFKVTAFFFTRDMVRDHIQRLIDEYYICEPDLVQQLIDYYSEVTPQCGEAISWVWFAVNDKGHSYADKRENRYFMSYLSNFKDKFYLDFGVPRAQRFVDDGMRDFLYQYQDRGKFNCGPEFKEMGCASGCEEKDCSMSYDCTDGKCPVPRNKAHDEAPDCREFQYSDFDLDLNAHYLYSPRKAVIEDITYDPVAQAYRWKFAWRFNDCEVDWLRQMCTYGEKVKFALVLSDPHWYARAELDGDLKRDLLAAMDPQTWGNIWPAGNIPYDMECCPCGMPSCPGNCAIAEAVGWEMPAPAPEPIPVTPPTPDFPPPPPPEEPEEVIQVPGKG